MNKSLILILSLIGMAALQLPLRAGTGQLVDDLHKAALPVFDTIKATGDKPATAMAAPVTQAPKPGQPERNPTDSWNDAPFWSSQLMKNEPILFIQEEGSPCATGKLLFIPASQPLLTQPDLVQKYEAGKDYKWTPGTATIELTPGSRIPFKTAAEMKPAKGGMGGRLWSEGHFFHDLQVQATYPHSDVWTWQPPSGSPSLTRSLVKLKERKGLRIVALGDSITEGYNASGFSKVNVPPYQPCYAQLVANILQQRFGSPVTLLNLGVAGTRADNGLTKITRLTEANPDLVLIAYGMNHQEAGPQFEAGLRALLTAVQQAAPEADVVLVSPMTQAPAQGKVAPKYFDYRDALQNLTSPKVALADVTTPFAELLKRKQFSDLSGNNYNHPNDFTHRLYAQVICQLFQAGN
ncbi:MAG: SGNH/GDSL hydrolase family protein [Verrucomicrobia bacterium]|nr:SGNH/GDSL hydrolase family protein [Verrucomicrobiota bacterium]